MTGKKLLRMVGEMMMEDGLDDEQVTMLDVLDYLDLAGLRGAKNLYFLELDGYKHPDFQKCRASPSRRTRK